MNLHRAGPCDVDDVDVTECWANGCGRAEKILWGYPQLGLEKGFFARWERSGFGMLAPNGIALMHVADDPPRPGPTPLNEVDGEGEEVAKELGNEEVERRDADVGDPNVGLERADAIPNILQATSLGNHVLFVRFKGWHIHVSTSSNCGIY